MSEQEPKPEDTMVNTEDTQSVPTEHISADSEEEVEGNRPEDEPAPGQTKATDVKPTPPAEPPKVEEPPKTPSKDITFGYIPEGNMAHFTSKEGDTIDYMQVAAITIEHGGRMFTYRRNRID